MSSVARCALAIAIAVSAYAPSARAANTCLTANDAAQDLRNAGKLREARAQLLVCSRPSCNAVVRADCEKWLKEVDAQMPSLVVRTVDSRGRDVMNARVTIDETTIDLDGNAVPVDPGQHVIRAKAKSGDIAEQKALVVIGEKARVIEIRFNAELTQDGLKQEPIKPPNNDDPPKDNRDTRGAGPSSGESPRVVPLLLAGIGVVSLGVFGFLEISAQSDFSDLKDTCAPKCPPSRTEPVKDKFVAASVMLGVSAVALGAAAILYFTGRSKPVSTAGSFIDLRTGALRF